MYVKDLYNENYKTLKKEIEDNTRRWKDPSYSWISKINVLKMAILAKAIYRLYSPSKFQCHSLRTRKRILKFI
jgi:hypothetical protein